MALTKIKTGSVSDSITLTTPDINGGTIDGAVIGGATAAAISGTTGTFSSTVRAVGTTLTSAPSATLAFTGTTSRLESRGADVSTRGAIELMQATSNGSSEIVALGFDAAGAATFNSSVTIPDYVIHDGNTTTKLGFGSANTMNFISNGSDRLTIANSYAVFNEGGTDYDFRVESSGNANMLFVDGGNDAVGIGVSNPSDYYANNLVVTGPSEGGITIASTGNHTNYLLFADSTSGVARYAGMVEYAHTIDQMAFRTNSIQRMVIDSSGNLLVGKTVINSATVGVEARGDGRLFAGATSSYSAFFNRLSSDGAIVHFAKDDTTVGSIAVQVGNRLVISGTNGSSSGVGLYYGQSVLLPTNHAGTLTDNAIDLGQSNVRFDDIYATNGTIQTSDRNEKQDIAELSGAEQRVAVACKGLLRKFRWKDSVAEKGDDARIHFGIIAQDLQAAFEAEGLDAGDYAMFISTTWWETQTDVAAVEAVEAVEFVQAVEASDAVEAVEAVYDEDGELVSEAVEAAEAVVAVEGVEAVEAVEAKDAYIRTDTFDTEAPEGATEKTRMGVRYSELLAFIIAAI